MNEKMVTVTLQLFSEKGIKFTMDDVAIALGMSKRTLYEQVGTKEALLHQIIDTVFDELQKQKRAVLQDETLDELSQLKKVLVMMPLSMQLLDYTKTSQIKAFYPAVHQHMIHRLDIGWEPTFELLESCMRRKQLKAIHPQLFKMMFLGMIEKVVDEDLIATTHQSYEQTLQEMIHILFEGLEGDVK